MSSVSENLISNSEAVPVIKSDLFKLHPDKRFVLAVFDGESVLSYESNPLTKAYLKLRANVYMDQKNILSSNAKRKDGTETDKDDIRSTHFVVFENRGDNMIAAFACVRFIRKSDKHNEILPIEGFFPDSFIIPAPLGSIEASRFIVRHDEIRYQKTSKKVLMMSGLAHSVINNLGPVYGVLETALEENLIKNRIPVTRIADIKWIPIYNSYNLGLEIHKDGYKQLVGSELLRKIGITINGLPGIKKFLGGLIIRKIYAPVGSFRYW